MAEHRPFPPSPRRIALARKAGLTAASPVVVGAAACAAAIAVIAVLGRAAGAQLGAWIAAACDGRAALGPSGAAGAVLELALPVLGAAAIAAVAAHLAQTRALWLPRRDVPDAPQVARGGVRAALDVGFAVAIGAVAFGWLWLVAPRLALLFAAPVAGGAWLIASLVVTLAITWVVLGALDALVRHVAVTQAMAMTPADKRADDRLASADPRWRPHRARIGRGPQIGDAVAGAALVLLGDDAAVAIAWHPARQPIPLRVATGRGPRATQLLGLARRYRIPVHRDPALVSTLVQAEGPVPEPAWARLAEVVAAVRR